MTPHEFEGRNRHYFYFFCVGALVIMTVAVANVFYRAENIWLFLALFGVIFAGMYIDNKVVTHLGLRCPACKRHLNACCRFVLATGKCRCGAQILEGAVGRHEISRG
jgi:hypothetical protein